MALFQLDPQSIATRTRATGDHARPPSLSKSVGRGVAGFTVVSIAGFAPWAIIGRWFHGVSEIGLYAISTAIFLSLSGVLLHRLIIGPGSLWRFYKLFALAFVAYAIFWVALWMRLRGDAGSICGLLAGTAAMGTILAFAFDAWRELAGIVTALFVLNTLGYYAGGWVEGKLIAEHRVLAMLLWGAGYGLGFGAGLGVAFHLCQKRARAALASGESEDRVQS